jgi:GNAT superfamily N-acetyltransferase
MSDSFICGLFILAAYYEVIVMKIPVKDFLQRYKEMFIAKTPYISTLAYWKMKHLIEEGETYYLPEYSCYYMIRDKHLLVYYSPDHKLHISIDELNTLDCISLPAEIFDTIKDKLVGFCVKRAWGLRYNFYYEPPKQLNTRYEAINFNFFNMDHYKKAAEIINDGSGWLTEKNIERMTEYSAFDPSLWFFVQDTISQELVAISISAYDSEVKQTDLDWIYVSPLYQGRGAGRFLIEETIRRCKDKSDDICVGGTVEFYRRCGFYDYEQWVWASKDGYQLNAPKIQP